MVSAAWPCWKAITTESRDTPSGPTRSAPWESSSTYLFDEIMRSSEPRFADAQADPKVILPPRAERATHFLAPRKRGWPHPGERWSASCCALNKRDGRLFTLMCPFVITRIGVMANGVEPMKLGS